MKSFLLALTLLSCSLVAADESAHWTKFNERIEKAIPTVEKDFGKLTQSPKVSFDPKRTAITNKKKYAIAPRLEVWVKHVNWDPKNPAPTKFTLDLYVDVDISVPSVRVSLNGKLDTQVLRVLNGMGDTLLDLDLGKETKAASRSLSEAKTIADANSAYANVAKALTKEVKALEEAPWKSLAQQFVDLAAKQKDPKKIEYEFRELAFGTALGAALFRGMVMKKAKIVATEKTLEASGDFSLPEPAIQDRLETMRERLERVSQEKSDKFDVEQLVHALINEVYTSLI